jgi:hypothetical protein
MNDQEYGIEKKAEPTIRTAETSRGRSYRSSRGGRSESEDWREKRSEGILSRSAALARKSI